MACLTSVVAQTFRPVQVIVIDDNSGDGTRDEVDRCRQSLQQAGIELEYLRLQQNLGPSAARNAGIRMARGTYVSFLDADDIWAAEKLAIVDAQIRDRRPGLVCHSYTDAERFPFDTVPKSRTAEVMSIHRMLWRNPAQTSCAVIRRDLGLTFHEGMRYCEDHDLWLRIAERAPVIRILGSPLTRLSRPQLSPGGLSGDTIRMRLGEMRVYYNFCRRSFLRRIWMLPALTLFSVAKHGYSWCRRALRQ